MWSKDCIFNKTIAITGASKGVGKETAFHLEQMGARLLLGSRSFTEMKSHDQLRLPLDVSNEDSVLHFIEKGIEYFSEIDVWINCAGVGTFSSILESTTESFDEMINTNLRGTYLCCKHIGKHMKVQNRGHIINLVSIAAKTAIPGCGGYAASKHGVLGLTRILQAELRTEGIQVTSVIPGSISSPFWDGIENKPDLEQMIPPDTLAAHLLGLIHQPPGAYVDEITIMPPLGIL